MPFIDTVQIESLAREFLIDAGASETAAIAIARSMVQAETQGNTVCGLFYLKVFKEQMKLNKVNGQAVPKIMKHSPSSLQVDAKSGFAHLAIELATEKLIPMTRKNGIAAAGICRSYNAMSLSHHVLPLAHAGLIGFCCSNAPASVAPKGASKAIFGTNPMAFAVPGSDGPAIVIDQSASAVTKTKVLMRKKNHEDIPLGWAQDNKGQPTTDPAAGLEGSLLPFGGHKGANIGLIVEILAAILTGSNLSVDAPSFSGQDTGCPHVGQFLLAIDPSHFAGEALKPALDRLAKQHSETGVRMPGNKFRNQSKNNIEQKINVDAKLFEELEAINIKRSKGNK